MIKKLLALGLSALCLAGSAVANTGGPAWDKFPKEKMNSVASLQNGAKLFVNYCLNCHGAAYMRYNRLADIGLTEAQIKDNLLFAGEKIGETMKVSIDPREAKAWFGATPPDLTVIARSRAGAQGSGADYLYTYLRSYYRDDTKATGWNNTVFPSVAMPHVLWELQGQPMAIMEEIKDPHDPSKVEHHIKGFELAAQGQMSPQEYDSAVGDLVAFLQWMGEPAQNLRFNLGVGVLIFLGLFFLIARKLNAAYWKDVK